MDSAKRKGLWRPTDRLSRRQGNVHRLPKRIPVRISRRMGYEVQNSLLIRIRGWIRGRSPRTGEARIIGIIHPAPAVIGPQGVIPVLDLGRVSITDRRRGQPLLGEHLGAISDVEYIVGGDATLHL